MPKKGKAKKSSGTQAKGVSPSDALISQIKSLSTITRSTNYSKTIGKINKLLFETVSDEAERRALINEQNLLAHVSEHLFNIFEKLTAADFELSLKLFLQLLTCKPHFFVHDIKQNNLLVFILQERIESLHQELKTMPLSRQTTIIEKGGWLSKMQQALEDAIIGKLCDTIKRLPQRLDGSFGIKSLIMPHTPVEVRGIYTFIKNPDAKMATNIERLEITGPEGNFESKPVDDKLASKIRQIIGKDSTFEPIFFMQQHQFESSWSIRERNIVCNPIGDNQVVFRFGNEEGNEAIYLKTIDTLKAKGVDFIDESDMVASRLIQIIKVDESNGALVRDTIVQCGDVLFRGKAAAAGQPSAHGMMANGSAAAAAAPTALGASLSASE